MVNPCDVLAFGAHPDDVELGCGATLARLAAGGRRVAVVDLTAGELGTRGDRDRRRAEADRAGGILGLAWRECLNLPDGGLAAHDPEQRAALVRVLRAARPRAVLAPDPDDPHPDHPAAAGLVRHAAYLAGLRRFLPEAGDPHRPRLQLSYPGPRQLLRPALVVDVSSAYQRKRAALAAHGSQFEPTAGPATHLASGHFLFAIEGRDRTFGNLVGSEFGEGFSSSWPLAADELVWLLTAGEMEEGRGESTKP